MTTAAVQAKSATSVTLTTGAEWIFEVLAAAVPVVTVTAPDGAVSTPAADVQAGLGWNRYSVTVTLDQPGRWVAMVTADGGAAGFTAWADDVVTAAQFPDITDVDDYLDEHSWTDDRLQDALDAEAAAQRSVCRIPATYPDDMRQALLRRVQRNLSMRGQPGVSVSDQGTAVYQPTRDPEVRRLEGPWRKLPTG